MPSCFVSNCTNGTHEFRRKPGVSFHRFPKRATKEWLIAIGRDPLTFIAHDCVCSEHFKKEDFEDFGARKTLKTNVVPSVNLPLPTPSEGLTHSSSSSDTDLENVPPDQQNQPGPSEVSPKREFMSSPSTSSDSSPKKTHIQKGFESSSSATSSVNRRIIKTFHTYSLSPSHAKYNQREQLLKKRGDFYKSRLKYTRRTSVRRKRNIINLRQVVWDLKKRFAHSTEAIAALEIVEASLLWSGSV